MFFCAFFVTVFADVFCVCFLLFVFADGGNRVGHGFGKPRKRGVDGNLLARSVIGPW